MRNTETNKTKQRVAGITLQYIQMFLNIVIGLLYTPIMLRMLGKNQYGIYNLAASIIAYLSLLSLGFGASYVRFYSRYKEKEDHDAISRMNGLYLIVFSIIGLIAFFIGIVLSKNAHIFYNETYSVSDINTAKIIMFILAINISFSFPFSVFNSYLTAQEEFVVQKLLNMGKTIIGPIVNIIVLYLGYGSVGMVVATTIITLIIDIMNVIICIKKLEMKASFRNPDFRLLKDIFVFSIFIAINQIIDQVNWQTDKVILGKLVNGGAVAVYAVGAQINTMFTSFSTAISSVFAPKINMIVAKNDVDMDTQLTKLFIRVGRIQWYLLFLILIGFAFFGKFFINIWAGEGYENAYIVALLLMSPAIVPLIQNIGIEVQRAKNKHRFRSITYAIMALINIVISIFLAKAYGEIGAAIGTSISLIIANGIVMNIYYQNKLGIDIVGFWKSIFSTMPGMVIPICCGVILTIFYRFNSMVDYCLIVVAFVAVYGLSVYFFSFNREEKIVVRNVSKKLFNKL